MKNEKWLLFKEWVEENEEKMGSLSLEEVVKGTPDPKKLDTFKGAEQAFGEVLRVMNQIEEEEEDMNAKE